MPDYDLKAFLDDDPLVLHNVASTKYPKGHDYSAPDLPHRDRLRLIQILVDAEGNAAKAIKANGPLALLTPALVGAMQEFCKVDGEVLRPGERLLGDAYRQMVDDGVSSSHIDRIEQIAILHYAGGEQLTKAILQAVSGEAKARANRASRRAAAKKATASSRKAGSSSNRASTASNSRSTRAAASTRSSKTSAAKKATARKTA